MQTGAFIDVMLLRRQHKIPMENLNVRDSCGYVGPLLVIYYKYGACHNMVALPFLFGQILFDQETDSL